MSIVIYLPRVFSRQARHVFLVFLQCQIVCFPALRMGAYFPALCSGCTHCMYSRAWHGDRVFPLLVRIVCFPALSTGSESTRTLRGSTSSREILIGSLRCCACCDWLMRLEITLVYLFGPFPLTPVMDTGSGSFLLSIAWTLQIA